VGAPAPSGRADFGEEVADLIASARPAATPHLFSVQAWATFLCTSVGDGDFNRVDDLSIRNEAS